MKNPFFYFKRVGEIGPTHHLSVTLPYQKVVMLCFGWPSFWWWYTCDKEEAQKDGPTKIKRTYIPFGIYFQRDKGGRPMVGFVFLWFSLMISSYYYGLSINDQLVYEVKEFLGEEGISFFKEVYAEYGEICAVWNEEIVLDNGEKMTVPHSVHFKEGMQVRNFLRSNKLCKDWTNDDFDNKWSLIVKDVIDQ